LAADGATGLRRLDRPKPDVAEASAALRDIVANAQRASEIIARIRDIAAGKATQQTLLSLHDVIDETLLFPRHELQLQGCRRATTRPNGGTDGSCPRLRSRRMLTRSMPYHTFVIART